MESVLCFPTSWPPQADHSLVRKLKICTDCFLWLCYELGYSSLDQQSNPLLSDHTQSAREIAYAQGKAVTFMAKWDENFAGSSMHMHVSLWDKATNLFAGDQKIGPVAGSEIFRWFLGGWMKRAREFAVCYAPNVSSYKRYQSASFAPTAIAWSYDNRTAGFRVVGHDQSLRIECRIPGADANPYIAYAAAIASGLDGIKNQIEPPPILAGDIYHAKDLPSVPATLVALTRAPNRLTYYLCRSYCRTHQKRCATSPY